MAKKMRSEPPRPMTSIVAGTCSPEALGHRGLAVLGQWPLWRQRFLRSWTVEG